MSTIMQDFWHQLEREIEKLAPDLLCKFHSGADDHAIAQAEQRLGMAFPEEVKAFFREHNGSGEFLFGHWMFLSLEEAYQEWLRRKTAASQMPVAGGEVSLRFWNRSWFPLMRAYPGDL